MGTPTITNVAVNDPTCGNNNGNITITASGGLAPLQYSIDNGVTFQAANNFTGLSAATYNIVVEDANGCQSTTTAILTNTPLSVTYTALANLCINAGVQTGLGGGLPTGGTYSGIGVTDDGNGMTYSFDPAAAGTGTNTITYSYIDGNGCSGTANDNVEVFALPNVTFTAPADLCLNAGIQAGLGGGLPTGGTYSGAGVTDDGNGMTYSFDPATAGTVKIYVPAGTFVKSKLVPTNEVPFDQE